MHEFLLLKIERPGNRDIWMRLERRVHENSRAANSIISPVLSGDTVSTVIYLSGTYAIEFSSDPVPVILGEAQ